MLNTIKMVTFSLGMLTMISSANGFEIKKYSESFSSKKPASAALFGKKKGPKAPRCNCSCSSGSVCRFQGGEVSCDSYKISFCEDSEFQDAREILEP